MIRITKLFVTFINLLKYIFIFLSLYLFFLVIYDFGILTGIILTLFIFPIYLLLVLSFANSFSKWLFDKEEYLYYESMTYNKSLLQDLKYSDGYKFYAKVYDFLFIDNQRSRFLILNHLIKYWYIYLITLSLLFGFIFLIIILI